MASIINKIKPIINTIKKPTVVTVLDVVAQQRQEEKQANIAAGIAENARLLEIDRKLERANDIAQANKPKATTQTAQEIAAQTILELASATDSNVISNLRKPSDIILNEPIVSDSAFTKSTIKTNTIKNEFGDFDDFGNTSTTTLKEKFDTKKLLIAFVILGGLFALKVF